MAVARLGQGKPADGRDWAKRATRSARAIGDSATLIRALMAVDFADQQLGRSGIGGATREALRYCVETNDRPQESVARANLGVLAFYAGRWGEAIEWLTTSSRVALEAGNDYGAAETDLTYADILIHQGRLDEAEQVLGRAFRVLKASGIDEYAVHAEVLRARIHLARRELGAAELLATGAAAEFIAMDSALDALEATVVQAEAMTEQGRPADALAVIEAARGAAAGEAVSLEARCQLVRGRAMLALGDRDGAAAAIEGGIAAAVAQELPYEHAMLLLLRAQWHRSLADGSGVDRARVDEDEASGLLRGLGVA
jgi:tetratricopeptide (TPR) repeat protein